MINVQVNDDQRKYAQWLIENGNYANRSNNHFNGDKKRQYVGKLAEVVFADENDLPRPVLSHGYDGGYDFILFGKHIDTKAMTRNCEVQLHFICQLAVTQAHNPDSKADVYVFASYNKKNGVMTYVGLVPKDKLPDTFTPEGTVFTKPNGDQNVIETDMYEMLVSEVMGFDTWPQMYDILLTI